ncbi:MAG: hydroxylase [Gordonia sp.]|nr:hydroxylase [Gordonia sp. (in: high G+C Gram-positive bacteria)]
MQLVPPGRSAYDRRMTSTAAPSGDRAGRAAPDAGQAAISEAPATAKLFAILLAGEHAAFTRLMIESQLAPGPAGQISLGKMIAAEVDHYSTLENHLRDAGIDPVAAIARYRRVFDQYHGATTPSNWNEVLIKAYIGDNLAADFYSEFVDVVPAVPIGDVIREVMSQTDNSQFACAEVRAAIARDPDIAAPLKLWARRLLGEAVTHAQWVLAAEEDVTDLLFSGVTSLQGVATFFDTVEQRHAERMADLGLV